MEEVDLASPARVRASTCPKQVVKDADALVAPLHATSAEPYLSHYPELCYFRNIHCGFAAMNI
eukprot:1724728-Pleurochrysis_carterae.AAC.2